MLTTKYNFRFEAPCFQHNLNNISPSCKTFYEKWILSRHFLIGVFISGSMMVVASGLLSVLALCCCLACCVRVCVKRRKMRRLQQLAANDTELAAPAKSVNQDVEEAPLSQTQFVFPTQQFPPQAAFSPYSSQPYMQPVFTVVQQ